MFFFCLNFGGSADWDDLKELKMQTEAELAEGDAEYLNQLSKFAPGLAASGARAAVAACGA